MGYFGKCEHEMTDHGPSSVEFYHPKNKYATAIALRLDGDLFIFTMNQELIVTAGVIATCQFFDKQPSTHKYSLDEPAIWRALTAERVRQETETKRRTT
jgi:hypothetical protein